MRTLGLALAVLLGLVAPGLAAAATEPRPAELAALYRRTLEPQLQGGDRSTLLAMETTLRGAAGSERERRIDSLVNQLGMALMAQQSLDGLTVGAALLVESAPEDWRTLNLFGAVLQAGARFHDAGIVLERARAVAPQDRQFLAKLNLANLYLDLPKLEAAKRLLDALVVEQPDDRSVWKALAAYHFAKGDQPRFREALLKSAEFGGYVQQEEKAARAELEAKLPKPSDGDPAVFRKLKELAQSVPRSTADVIEKDAPDAAARIRAHYGRLIDSERLRLPAFPEVNSSSNQAFTEQLPVVEDWLKLFAQRYADSLQQDQYADLLRPGQSAAQQEAAGRAYAEKMLRQQAQQVQQLLGYMESTPGAAAGAGANHWALKEAVGQMQAAARAQGIDLSPRAPATASFEHPPGYDSGSVFAVSNYGAYLQITQVYEQHLDRMLADYRRTEAQITEHYQQELQQENARHEIEMERQQRLATLAGESGCPRCKEQQVRHKQRINAIGLQHFQQWAQLYLPQYQQKFRPVLEDYWKVAALYIRNMNDAEVMQREYHRVRARFMVTAYQVSSGAATGAGFLYLGPTDEEEAALREMQEAAKQTAERKRPQLEEDYPWVDAVAGWVADNFVLEVSAGPFLSLKVTGRAIEFEAWAFGPGAGMKADFADGTLESYISVSAKFTGSVHVFGVGAEVEGQVEVAKRTARWDFSKGTYEENTSIGAKVATKTGLGPIGSVTTEIEVDAELNSKVSGKMTVGDKSPIGDVSLSQSQSYSSPPQPP